MTCSPLKQAATTQSRSNNSAQEQAFAELTTIRDSAFFRSLYEALRAQLAIEQTREQATTENIETVTREYDTSRPADSLTGKPPLLRETTQRQVRTDSVRGASHLRQTQTLDTYAAAEGETHGQDQLHLREESNRQTAAETATETKNQRGLMWWQKALCFVGLLTLLYAGYRIYKNF